MISSIIMALSCCLSVVTISPTCTPNYLRKQFE